MIRMSEFVKQMIPMFLLIKWVNYRYKRLEVAKVVIGSGDTHYKGWLSTDVKSFNITKKAHWQRLFGERKFSFLLAEHVMEHLTESDFKKILGYSKQFSESGAVFRIAVPDGFFPGKGYIEQVKPGGSGAGSDDHKVLYNYIAMVNLIESCGLDYSLVEYYDENKVFYSDYDDCNGYIKRSSVHDWRNKNGTINYSSLIVDVKYN